MADDSDRFLTADGGGHRGHRDGADGVPAAAEEDQGDAGIDRVVSDLHSVGEKCFDLVGAQAHCRGRGDRVDPDVGADGGRQTCRSGFPGGRLRGKRLIRRDEQQRRTLPPVVGEGRRQGRIPRPGGQGGQQCGGGRGGHVTRPCRRC